MRRAPVTAVLGAVLFIISSLIGSRAFGQNSSDSRSPTVVSDEPLRVVMGKAGESAGAQKGIAAVYLIVPDLSYDAKALGLDRETIETDVQLQLRLAGVRVLSEQQSLSNPGNPYLYVDVSVAGCAAAIAVELRQNARLERNGKRAMAVTTWSAMFLETNPTAKNLRGLVKDQIDQFLKATHG